MSDIRDVVNAIQEYTRDMNSFLADQGLSPELSRQFVKHVEDQVCFWIIDELERKFIEASDDLADRTSARLLSLMKVFWMNKGLSMRRWQT